MSQCVCRIVLLAGLLGSSGCYAMHGLEPSGVAPVDAGLRRADGGTLRPALDAAASAVDASAPLMCPRISADAYCGHLPLQAGIPQTLPLTFDACTCCAQTECSVRVSGRTRDIELTTTLCPDPCDCDTCAAPTVECELPPLGVGDWRVSINGAPAFLLPFVEGAIEATLPMCLTRADEDRCAPSFMFGSVGPWRAGALCADEARDGFAPSKLEVFGDCAPCAFVQGPCTASMAERFTDEFPPGADLFVDLSAFPTVCDVGCPAVCSTASHECITPPLRRGDFYRVFAGDDLIGAFIAGSGERGCAPWRD